MPSQNKSDTSADQNVARIKQEWLEYEGEAAHSRMLFNNAVKKQLSIDALGPASKALLDYVNENPIQHSSRGCMRALRKQISIWHPDHWWRALLIALWVEGHIDGRIYRKGDKIVWRFRKKPEAAK